MKVEIEKVYEPSKTESKWYKKWKDGGFFRSRPEAGKKPFTIVIPPPNVTGSLHMGHALNNTLQDIIIRFKKMRNFNALWVPGTDHGGIATQNVVEKLLKAEGKDRHALGREKFIERMWQWRAESGDTILNQLTRLGCALDWERTRFTMDETCSRAVLAAFIELFNRGLIYRGKRLVNWCPRCHTALADIEVEHEEEIGKLWHIKYPIEKAKGDKKEKFLVVATTRPETMLGDTGVAVNPEDKRYKKLKGSKILLPLVGREIPLVYDDAVDMTFGTGAVKVTPAHDPTDFEIAARHKLPHVVVIDFHGRMTEDAGADYKGLDRYEARKKVLHDLEARGLLLETVDHPHSIGHCYRCNSVVEPLVSEQWFLKVEEMSRKAMKAAEDGRIKFYPESWRKPYMMWLENLRDWCISRQIWWGHRIPVYYCRGKEQGASSKEEMKQSACPPIVSAEPPKKCPKCGGTNIEQDPDVLDTWFSSALWPFSVFGWPDKGRGKGQGSGEGLNDLEYYYPTSVLVTGHEILYLWVARMVQMGLTFMGDIPFSEVFIHGIVRDKSGKKMSKSLGNVIDPLGVMEKYGTDALRFALTQSAAPGRDMQLSEDSFVSARNFANKIWNASRFVMMNVEGIVWDENHIMTVWPMELADRWILSEYRKTVRDVTKAIENYDMDVAARTLYEFFWSKYCDWYIELAKIRIGSDDLKQRKAALSILIELLAGTLRMLSPVMPYLTEELWQSIRGFVKHTGSSENIMLSSWPEADESKIDQQALDEMALVQQVITSVRTIRSEMNVPPGKGITVTVKPHSDEKRKVIERNGSYLQCLAKIETMEINSKASRPKQSALAVISGYEIFVPLSGLIDLNKEKTRLEKELTGARQEIERCNQKLGNESFVTRAPAAEVDKIKQRLGDAQLKSERIAVSLQNLG
ncbi:MAG: valine--tRNA ligase [Endomicrobiales bacterium]|nr:valine--tRNA ligase [Endomicrobiales bacterium]